MNLKEITQRSLDNLKKTKYPPIETYAKQGWFTLQMAMAECQIGEKLMREALQNDPKLERRSLQYISGDVVCRAVFYRQKEGGK